MWVQPVMTSTSIVLSAVANTIGPISALIISKYSIRATPGGTKKNPMFFTRKLDIVSTHSNLITFTFSKKVRSNIPRMLDGIVMGHLQKCVD